MRSLVACWVLFAACAAAPDRPPHPHPHPHPQYDIAVYGATSAGVVAAVQAARQGNSVVLIEPGQRIGGLSSSGLGATDIGNKAAIGGIAREFYRSIRAHYARDGAWVFERREDFPGRGHRQGEDAAWTFEPSVALAVFQAMVQEAGIEVLCGQRLDLQRGVERDGDRIVGLRMESGLRIGARIFLDCTYEGDLMALAGVTYTVGREANARYGETLNGVQTERAVYHQFTHPVDPYVVPGDPTSGLLPGIGDGPGAEGTSDRRVQAYCYRLCATDVPENRIPWPKPRSYDESLYELLLRSFEAGDRRRPWHPVAMPNRKTDSNNNFAVSTDFIGGNYDYPEADYPTRERSLATHRSWQQGLMWTLANHPRVPAEIRAEFSRWGLCRDEFTDTDHWPPQLYIREARRMVSAVVMTEHHCRGTEIVEDSVGMGAYGMDSHHVQRYVTGDGTVRNEGDVQVHGFVPYPISYEAIVPRRGECENLLVPVCLSASHIAFGSIRMEPVFMVLGQSAAIAAGLAVERGVAVQDIGYGELETRLGAAGQVLSWQSEPRVRSGIDAATLPGLLCDDRDAELEGTWAHSTSAQPYLEYGYRHDGDTDKGQRRAPADPPWTSLGRFPFAPDAPATVTLHNRGTDGHVIVDAVQLLPVQ